MKTTGIIRRIDELGRIVIPKEIRKNLTLKTNDSMEILIEDEDIVLKKYQPLGKLVELSKSYSRVLSDMTDFSVCISDTDKIIAVSGCKKELYLGESISNSVLEIMEDRAIWSTATDGDAKNILLSSKDGSHISQIISPIICDADVIGSVIIFSKDSKHKITDVELKLVKLTSMYLGTQLE